VLVPVEHPGPRVRVGEAALRFGREPSCDVLLADLTVSRRHARVFWSGQDLVIEDLGSSGGTFVNSERVQRAPLHPGDLVRLGPRLEYRLETEAATTTLTIVARQKGDEEESVRQLHVLLDVARALNAATVVDEVLETVLQAAVKLLAADRGYCLVREAGARRTSVVSYPRGETETTWVTHSSLLEKAIAERKTVFTGPQARSESMVQRGVSSALATPLLAAHRPMGVAEDASFVASLEVIGGILVERRTAGRVFTRDDLGVLERLAADAAAAVDSARLYREAREKARSEYEMALARTIQSALLREPPPVPFAETFAFSQPARIVGGDLHFSSLRADGSLALAVGDVSGKGVAAALIMAMVQGQLGLLHDLGHPFADVIPTLDQNLVRFNPGNRFLTLAMVLLEPDGRLQLANGGHCPVALLRADGTVSLLPSDGPIIGRIGGAAWGSSALALAQGDSLVLYSDGISESTSREGVEFGTAGVERTLTGLRDVAPAVIGRALLDAAAAQRGGREADDDVTLLVVRYGG
jgi:serine phosphatase RsbU (regulator of sigma subunit)